MANYSLLTIIRCSSFGSLLLPIPIFVSTILRESIVDWFIVLLLLATTLTPPLDQFQQTLLLPIFILHKMVYLPRIKMIGQSIKYSRMSLTMCWMDLSSLKLSRSVQPSKSITSLHHHMMLLQTKSCLHLSHSASKSLMVNWFPIGHIPWIYVLNHEIIGKEP